MAKSLVYSLEQKRTLHCGTADMPSEGDTGLPNTGCGHNPIFNTFSHIHPHTHTLPLANQTNDAMQWHAVRVDTRDLLK